MTKLTRVSFVSASSRTYIHIQNAAMEKHLSASESALLYYSRSNSSSVVWWTVKLTVTFTVMVGLFRY
jgi:hypothetical protein